MPSTVSFGGYEKKGRQMYNARKFNMTATRVAGSFHWQVPLNKVGFQGATFSMS